MDAFDRFWQWATKPLESQLTIPAELPKLKAAFEKHMAETDGQVERLEQVFASIDETPKGKTCDAIVGIIEEDKEVMDEYKGMPALDAGLLAAAQAVEHYEISRYGTLKTWQTNWVTPMQ